MLSTPQWPGAQAAMRSMSSGADEMWTRVLNVHRSAYSVQLRVRSHPPTLPHAIRRENDDLQRVSECRGRLRPSQRATSSASRLPSSAPDNENRSRKLLFHFGLLKFT